MNIQITFQASAMSCLQYFSLNGIHISINYAGRIRPIQCPALQQLLLSYVIDYHIFSPVNFSYGPTKRFPISFMNSTMLRLRKTIAFQRKTQTQYCVKYQCPGYTVKCEVQAADWVQILVEV